MSGAGLQAVLCGAANKGGKASHLRGIAATTGSRCRPDVHHVQSQACPHWNNAFESTATLGNAARQKLVTKNRREVECSAAHRWRPRRAAR